MLRLGPADHGRTCELALHQRLQLGLPEAPTSGYRWQGAEALGDDAAVRCVASSFEAPATDRVGGQGRRAWVFEARATGTAALRLTLQRPGGGAVADRFALTIHVVA
jgi:predicted secreted protein